MKARDNVSSAFPTVAAKLDNDQVGFLAFSSDMTGSGFVYGNLSDPNSMGDANLYGVKGFGPTAAFTPDIKKTVVMSSFSQFMAASAGLGSDAAELYGLQGSITEVPPGYSLSFVIAQPASGGGVNEAFEAWGDRLLQRYGKDRQQTYTDYALNYLGYSTDNG